MADQLQNEAAAEKVLPRMFVLMDKESKRTPFQYFVFRFYAKIVEWFDVNSFPLLIVGVLLNTYFLIKEPSALNSTFEFFYALIFIYKIIQAIRRRKQTGSVTDATTGQPVDLATVRVASGDRFLQVRVTDKSGLFFIILPPGNYTIFCSKGGYETASKKLFVPKAKKIKVAKLDFALRKTTN